MVWKLATQGYSAPQEKIYCENTNNPTISDYNQDPQLLDPRNITNAMAEFHT